MTKAGKKADLALNETPQGDKRAKVANYATPLHGSKVHAASKGKGIPGLGVWTARDSARAKLDTQIKSLQQNIRKNVKRVAYLVTLNQIEHAAKVCSIVGQNRAKLFECLDEYEAIRNAEPIPDVEIHRRSNTRPRFKVKRETTVFDTAQKIPYSHKRRR